MSKSAQDDPPVCYILRVYRRQPASRQIAGVVEIPEFDERVGFASFEELKSILCRPPPKDRCD